MIFIGHISTIYLKKTSLNKSCKEEEEDTELLYKSKRYCFALWHEFDLPFYANSFTEEHIKIGLLFVKVKKLHNFAVK